MTSVSVSDAGVIPSAASLAHSSAAFSTMPLWITATWPEASSWGWALPSVGSPWVAQRVWPMPTEPDSRLGSDATRSSTRPARRWTRSPEGPITATPAES
jgi:hypothetical protein